MLNKRTNILFDQATWNLLEQLSASREVSIGQLVRKAVNKLYKPQTTATTILLDRIKELGKKVNTKNINYKELIEYGRKY